MGTGFEIGFMRALNKPVFVYSNDTRLFFDRVKHFFNGAIAQDAQGVWRETKNNTSLEPFEMRDNLMIDGAAISSGGAFLAGNCHDPLRDLDIFRQVIPLVAAHFYGLPKPKI